MRLFGVLLSCNSKIIINNVKYQPIIGLEIHAQIACRTKLFSSAAYDDAAHANSTVSLFDMAIPGTLPVLNKMAVLKGVDAGVLLGCQIPERCRFVRKHYFYADLPAGYQITQHDNPIALDGHFDFYVHCSDKAFKSYKKQLSILRIQLENDSGRTIQDTDNNRLLIDLNRAGTALLEIVTAPSLYSALEAYCFVEQLRLTLIDNQICSGEMQKGQYRIDVNVSLAREGGTDLGVRTELKNLNSLRILYLAIENELERQRRILESGRRIETETLTVDASGQIMPMREKEADNDYRIMPEPNLPPIQIEERWIKNAKQSIVRSRFMRNIEDIGIEPHQALLIANDKLLANFADTLIDRSKLMGTVLIDWIHQLRLISRNCEVNFPPTDLEFIEYFLKIIALCENGQLTNHCAYDLLKRSLKDPQHLSPDEIVANENLWRIRDPDEVERAVCTTMGERRDLVEKIRRNVSKKKNLTKLRTAVLEKSGRRIDLNDIMECLQRLL